MADDPPIIRGQLIKILLVGDGNSGKTAFLHRYIGREKSFITTVGIDFHEKFVEVAGRQCTLQIWDTAGQERFLTVTKSYLRGANACVLMYDAADRESFAFLERLWIDEVAQLPRANTHYANTLIVSHAHNVGVDGAQRAVPAAEGAALAAKHGMLFVEANAATDDRVGAAFDVAACAVLHTMDPDWDGPAPEELCGARKKAPKSARKKVARGTPAKGQNTATTAGGGGGGGDSEKIPTWVKRTIPATGKTIYFNTMTSESMLQEPPGYVEPAQERQRLHELDTENWWQDGADEGPDPCWYQCKVCKRNFDVPDEQHFEEEKINDVGDFRLTAAGEAAMQRFLALPEADGGPGPCAGPPAARKKPPKSARKGAAGGGAKKADRCEPAPGAAKVDHQGYEDAPAAADLKPRCVVQ